MHVYQLTASVRSIRRRCLRSSCGWTRRWVVDDALLVYGERLLELGAEGGPSNPQVEAMATRLLAVWFDEGWIDDPVFTMSR